MLVLTSGGVRKGGVRRGDGELCWQCLEARSRRRASGSGFPHSFRGMRNRAGSSREEVVGVCCLPFVRFG